MHVSQDITEDGSNICAADIQGAGGTPEATVEASRTATEITKAKFQATERERKAGVFRGNTFGSHQRLQNIEQRLRKDSTPHLEWIYSRVFVQCRKAEQMLFELNVLIPKAGNARLL